MHNNFSFKLLILKNLNIDFITKKIHFTLYYKFNFLKIKEISVTSITILI